MVGYLLARAGVPVLVLEKHGDFLRDFRGDTIHPSTLEILDELGLADRFLALPHSKVATIMLRSTSGQTASLSLSRLPTKFPYIAFVPQWDFLEFLTAEAQRFPAFQLKRNAEAVDLIQSGGPGGGVVSGVRYVDADGAHDVTVPLVIGADGRTSRTREAAGLPQIESSPPMDVFWFRVSRRADEPEAVAGRIGAGKLCVMLNRGDYWQIAYLIPKGGADAIRAAGIEAFRRDVARRRRRDQRGDSRRGGGGQPAVATAPRGARHGRGSRACAAAARAGRADHPGVSVRRADAVPEADARIDAAGHHSVCRPGRRARAHPARSAAADHRVRHQPAPRPKPRSTHTTLTAEIAPRLLPLDYLHQLV